MGTSDPWSSGPPHSPATARPAAAAVTVTKRGADPIGHPGPIAAALNQSDRFDAAVLNVV